MVFFNYATMQMAAKIVYYGPGLCGKTTNLHWIYAKTSPQSRGEMVSLETETDRTLFFDLLPIDVGVIGGFKTRLQLYTIPGQVFYNTTRKLVLKGVDGVVFVADSQKAVHEANIESFKNLRENLTEIGLVLDEIPLVIQLNKRDLPNISDAETIINALDPERKYEAVEASAVNGNGVFETLKAISKITLRTLRKRMTGEEAQKAARRPEGRPFGAAAKAPSATFQVRGGSTPAHPATSAGAVATPAAAASARAPQPAPHAVEAVPAVATPQPLEAPAPPPVPAPPPAGGPEESLDFHTESAEAQPAKSDKPAPKAESDMKHMKVRSPIDIMGELEALRKRATQAPPKTRKDPVADALAALTTKKKEVFKNISLAAPKATLEKSRSLRVTISFEGDGGEVVQKEDQVIDLGSSADAQTLSVALKIDLNR